MNMIFGAVYVSMFIQFICKVFRKTSTHWGWTEATLPKKDINDGVDGWDVFTYCESDGLYHGWDNIDDEYVKVTARQMKLDKTSTYWLQNRTTGRLERARPIHVTII